MFLTADLRITNSPGVNIAGTVSKFPWPGTRPPLLNPFGPPPIANLPIEGKTICPSFRDTKVVSIGRRGSRDSAILINASANAIAPLARDLNVLLSMNVRTRASNFSLSFVTWFPSPCCALAASAAFSPAAAFAMANASAVVPYCLSKGITLPICLNPPSCSTISLNL